MAPGAFVFDKDRQIADVGDLSAAEFERVSLAERSCPTGAIYIE
jgi:ferredoxin